MSILDIRPVERSGMRFLFSFYGLSETGKTLSALMVAAGLEPDPAKRMLLDTEGGQRGRAYQNEIPGGYLYASLSPPYAPKRYIEALNEIEERGVTVLVTDSMSHAWFAEGGVLQMVEESNLKNDLAKWKDPKRLLGKMMQRYRSSDMHHILCSRAKQPLIEAKDENGRKIYVPGPIVPIQEKMMRYDMTVIAHMLGRGAFTLEAPQGKCPGNLLPIFTASPLMNMATGERLREWVGDRVALSPEVRALRVRGTEMASQGLAVYSEFWSKLSREEKAALLVEHGNLKSIAEAADAERVRGDADAAEEEQSERERSDTKLDDPFGAGGIQQVGNTSGTTSVAPAEDAFGLPPLQTEHSNGAAGGEPVNTTAPRGDEVSPSASSPRSGSEEWWAGDRLFAFTKDRTADLYAVRQRIAEARDLAELGTLQGVHNKQLIEQLSRADQNEIADLVKARRGELAGTR